MGKLKFIALWVVVGIPLVWGVSRTLQSALKLFQ
jgi:hypothetical protein